MECCRGRFSTYCNFATKDLLITVLKSKEVNVSLLRKEETEMTYSIAPAYNGSILHTFFSFKGRCTRLDYWLKGFIPSKILFFSPFFIIQPTWPDGMDTLVFVPMAILSTWIALAVGVKRFHDRGRAGGYILFSFIPIANLVVLIQLGFMDGDYGANFYGQDPKSREKVSS